MSPDPIRTRILPTNHVCSQFTSGQPSPTCTSGCGTLCTGGIFCSQPCLTTCGGTQNPDFLDPANPKSPQNPSNSGGTVPPTTTHPPPPSTTASSVFPTIGPSAGPIYCFSEHNDGNYVPFTEPAARAIANAFCDGTRALSPGNPYAYVSSSINPSKYTIFASAKWAANQDTCNNEANVIMGGTSCLASLSLCGSQCRFVLSYSF